MHVLRREFQLRKLLYSYKNERVFYCCQWRWPRLVFVAIRVFLGLYTIYGLIHMFVEHYIRDDTPRTGVEVTNTTDTLTQTSKKPIMVYFTVWSYILLTLHLVLAAILSIVYYKRAEADVTKFKLRPVSIIEKRPDGHTKLSEAKINGAASTVTEIQAFTNGAPNSPTTEDKTYVPTVTIKQCSELTTSGGSEESGNKNGSARRLSSYESFRRYHTEHMSQSTPWYFKVSWCLSDIVSVTAPIVTIIFFTALYPSMKNKPAVGLNLQDVNVHTLNLVFVVVDHVVSPRPIRLLHFVAPLIYGAIYIVFSVIYWSTDHVNNVVYKNVLDWNYPGISSGVAIGLAVVAIPLLQLSFFALYQLKCVIYRQLYDCSFHGDLD
nr:protein rolling stone-like [Biomphalaria glabrata]